MKDWLRRFPSTSVSLALTAAVLLAAVFWRINLLALPGLDFLGIEGDEAGQVSLAALLVIPAIFVDRAAARRRRREAQMLAELQRAHIGSSRLAAIVESSDDAILTKDLNGVITSWNGGAERLFGYTAADMVGTSIMRLIPEDRRAEEQHILDAIVRGAGVTNLETLRRAKDERLIDVSITSSPVRDESGRIIGASKTARDITERKQAEARLRLERDRAQQYLDTAGVILLALDLEGRVTLVNRFACTTLGWTSDELLGRDFIDTCVPAAIRQQTRDKLRNVQMGDDAIVENPIVTRSGAERLIEWRTAFLRDIDGRIAGTLSSGADITERHASLEAVRTAEERMRFALESADVGIWDMDYATGVLRWSETLEAHYGLSPGTFPGTFDAFIERIHPDDRALVLDTVGKAIKAGTDFSIQNRTIWPNGKVRWLSGSGRVLLGEHGEPVRAVGITLDVTERRSLEEQFQQAQKMEAIGRLAGGIAHDFNNLLTAILGYSQFVLADLPPADPHRADVAEIEKAGLRAAGLTRQLLAFSRKEIIEPTLLDLNELVSEVLVMLGRLIGEDVRVVPHLRDIGAIKADRGQVEQIILNLAVNARDAMPTGGTLTIETADVELDEHYASAHFSVTPGAYVALTVTDTGTGMPPDVQTHLFEPFFTTKEMGKGTGLGLATVHGIVSRGGGSIGVYSEVGRGSSFRVYFPRAAASEAAGEAPAQNVQPRVGGQTVLVVEDADALRALAKRLLERQGYAVLLAANAKEAIEQFERHDSIDVILTDVVMPGASGPELTRQLVERRPTLRVIYMSGYTEDAIVQHGVLQPGIAFLNKPFTAESLARKLQEVLDR